MTSSSLPKISTTIQDDFQVAATPNRRTVTAFVPYRIKKVSIEEKSIEACSPPLNRDERTLKGLKIPHSVDLIINSDTEEFNDLLINLNEDQRNLCRDIRRR